MASRTSRTKGKKSMTLVTNVRGKPSYNVAENSSRTMSDSSKSVKTKKKDQKGSREQDKKKKVKGEKVTAEQVTAMQAFLDNTLKLGNQGVVDQFHAVVESSTPTPEQCVVFGKCHERNRNEKKPCLDETRIILQGNNQNDYIHASKVKLPNFSRTLILSQFPLPDYVEDFWRMIFQENCTQIFVLAQPLESTKNFTELVPVEVGEYKYFGSMFINNKKVERLDAASRAPDKKNPAENSISYTLEVLPDGCSNSIFCKVVFYLSWPPACGSATFIPPCRFAMQIIDPKEVRIPKGAAYALQTGNVALVSLEGTGRTGTLAVIVAAINLLEKAKTPNICDLAVEVRKHRALAVENAIQFANIYSAVIFHIMNRLKDTPGVREKADTFKNGWASVQQF